MIQLPDRIRTTLFNASVEDHPMQLFSHEKDRIAVIIYPSANAGTHIAVGRSAADLNNAHDLPLLVYFQLTLYGTEPIWMGHSVEGIGSGTYYVLVHGIYRA